MILNKTKEKIIINFFESDFNTIRALLFLHNVLTLGGDNQD